MAGTSHKSIPESRPLRKSLIFPMIFPKMLRNSSPCAKPWKLVELHRHVQGWILTCSGKKKKHRFKSLYESTNRWERGIYIGVYLSLIAMVSLISISCPRYIMSFISICIYIYIYIHIYIYVYNQNICPCFYGHFLHLKLLHRSSHRPERKTARAQGAKVTSQEKFICSLGGWGHGLKLFVYLDEIYIIYIYIDIFWWYKNWGYFCILRWYRHRWDKHISIWNIDVKGSLTYKLDIPSRHGWWSCDALVPSLYVMAGFGLTLDMKILKGVYKPTYNGPGFTWNVGFVFHSNPTCFHV